MILCQNLTKAFGRAEVLSSFDLAVNKGERVALIGSNGAGKTTLIRCLLGEYRYQGKVEINGLTPRDERQAVLLHTGFVPQFPPPLKMPVGELIRFAAGVCGSDPTRMYSISEQLGLNAKTIRHRPFNKLSGGQKQKLLISIALGRDCDLLILDEPAANLDPVARQQFFHMLASYRDRVTMLISSHRLDEVVGLVNRVIELDQGKIVLDDAVAGQEHMRGNTVYTIDLHYADDGFNEIAREWGLTADATFTRWHGEIAATDQSRFLVVLSRYSGLISGLNMAQDDAFNESAPMKLSTNV